MQPAQQALLLRKLMLIGYFGTLVLVPLWYCRTESVTRLPAALLLAMLVLPLLAPLRGLVRGRRYTVTWSCFIALLYFGHGVVEAYSSPASRYPALLEVALTSLWCVGAMAYLHLSRPPSKQRPDHP